MFEIIWAMSSACFPNFRFREQDLLVWNISQPSSMQRSSSLWLILTSYSPWLLTTSLGVPESGPSSIDVFNNSNGESIDLKIAKIGSSKCKFCHFEPTCIPLSLTSLLPTLKYIKCVYLTNPMYSLLSWTKLHLNSPKTVLLIHLRKGQKPIVGI